MNFFGRSREPSKLHGDDGERAGALDVVADGDRSGCGRRATRDAGDSRGPRAPRAAGGRHLQRLARGRGGGERIDRRLPGVGAGRGRQPGGRPFRPYLHVGCGSAKGRRARGSADAAMAAHRGGRRGDRGGPLPVEPPGADVSRPSLQGDRGRLPQLLGSRRAGGGPAAEVQSAGDLRADHGAAEGSAHPPGHGLQGGGGHRGEGAEGRGPSAGSTGSCGATATAWRCASTTARWPSSCTCRR